MLPDYLYYHGECEECYERTDLRTAVKGDLNSVYLCRNCLAKPYTPSGG